MIHPTPLRVPVLLVIFNRPETTAKVMESLRAIQPPALYIAADGPRQGVTGEAEKCAEARRVAQSVEWDCEVATLFRDQNLGCGLAVSGGINWFFQHVDEGIVLEDDCVPGLSFYRFCSELLARYRDDPRIMHVAGTNLQYGRQRGRASYYFSKYPNVWGWASWRRAWKQYDFSLRPAWKLDDTWDTQWQLSIERSHGLAIVPNVNMVQNVGFGSGATHTRGKERPASLEAAEMAFPLEHPASLVPDRAADVFTYYAHHRMVRHLRLIWMYQIADFLFSRWKSAKLWVFGRR